MKKLQILHFWERRETFIVLSSLPGSSLRPENIFLPDTQIPGTYVCTVCSKAVRNKWHHMQVHFPGVHKCTICEAVYTRIDKLKAHFRRTHGMDLMRRYERLPSSDSYQFQFEDTWELFLSFWMSKTELKQMQWIWHKSVFIWTATSVICGHDIACNSLQSVFSSILHRSLSKVSFCLYGGELIILDPFGEMMLVCCLFLPGNVNIYIKYQPYWIHILDFCFLLNCFSFCEMHHQIESWS